MTKTILNISASSRTETSVSRQMADRLIGKISANGDTIVQRDTTKDLSIVSEDWINANFTPADDRTDEQKQILAQSDTLVGELQDADTIVISTPIYNFGIPAALKTWIDLIARVGKTFQYTENGPEGLLTGKRAIILVASGGVPIGAPVDHATPLLKTVLGFVGITDVQIIGATGLAMDSDGAIAAANAEIDAAA
ncbi:FMN-dependent NADH-azoreductase [Amylibacter kogurei]|uniref:FMN dependent NADH:quinone oxidoreductase n=1 Tax=Paramylibacter kogurei TaxID=1889778 RepID=A0A2G5K9J0_9RHOB|nr:NAD(P)H-dependent oxidoreductase [Amylibacter kogurei]PIB26105.1 FMN-dependent NADH-azoreductase [Amylibacter kogurei]